MGAAAQRRIHQMTPLLTDLGDNATDINTFIRQLGPFSQAGIPALKSLGSSRYPALEPAPGRYVRD